MKIVKYFQEFGFLIKGSSKTSKNKVKEQKMDNFSVLFGTIRTSLLATLLAGKVIKRATEGTIRLGHDF